MFTQRQNSISRVAVRLMLAAGAAALMAGCSDASRFSDPFSDPFSSGSAPKISRSGVDRAPTGSIGGAVSSGCIRMMNSDVIELYDRVKVGAKVYVYQ